MGRWPDTWSSGRMAGAGTFAPALRYGGPAVAVVTLTLGVVLWNAGIRRYQSTGS